MWGAPIHRWAWCMVNISNWKNLYFLSYMIFVPCNFTPLFELYIGHGHNEEKIEVQLVSLEMGHLSSTSCTEHKLSMKLLWTDSLILNNVGRTLLLGLPQKQNGYPIGYITLLSVISPLKHAVQHLWRFIYGLLMMAMLVELLMGVKDPGKVQNQRVIKLWIVTILIKKFIPWQLIHACRYCMLYK